MPSVENNGEDQVDWKEGLRKAFDPDYKAAAESLSDEEMQERVKALRNKIAAPHKESRVPGIPFSSPDEAKGTTPIETAVKLVTEQIIQEQDDANQGETFTVYVVWFAYILGGWKALLSTSIADGRYFEVTYDVAKRNAYLDTYTKTRNEVHYL
jgi:hypothetical protein